MKLTGTKNRLLAGLGVFLGLLVAFYVLVYVPRVTYRESLRTKISRESTRLNQLLTRYRELDELQKEHANLQNRVYQMETMFRQDQATFLHELGTKGKLYGMDYIDIVPLKPTELEFYVRTPVSINLRCDYHNLGILLSDMASAAGRGYFTVDNVLFQKTYGPDYSIEARMTMSLYDYKGVSLSVSEHSDISAEPASLVNNRRSR